jgi:SET domain-containing protein
MLIVKKSRIPGGGKGLFTTSRIRKGDAIVEYKGEKISWEECEKRNRAHSNKAPYLFFISKNNCIDAEYTLDALARYANDAEGFVKVKGLRNNADYNIISGKPYIVATRAIAAGGEILVSYGKDYWELMKH